VNLEGCIEDNFREFVFCESALRVNIHRRAGLPPIPGSSSLISESSNLPTPLRPLRPLREVNLYALS
jgi:hypothetical protein